jgi:hypothetical protein
MGAGKMKKLLMLSIILICYSGTYSQTVDIYNPVYRFLERMNNHNIISRYNSYEIPKSRKEIISYIRQVIDKRELLNDIDRDILKDLEIEFETELYGTNVNKVRIIQNNGYDFLSEKQKYLYFMHQDDFELYINLYAEAGYIHRNIQNSFNNNASVGNAGGIIRGSIADKFGFYIRGTNGKVFGSSRAALADRRFEQSFKFMERPDESFYDDTEGHLTADFDIIRFKFGRDRLKLGYGEITLVDDHSPLFDYLGMYLQYSFFNYSFVHSKMLDISHTGDFPLYGDKFLVYHRIGFNINRHFNFGAGEFIIYGRRGVDLSYLNPFAFYKSVEHANRDRDNSMLFFDISNNSIPGTRLHFTLLMDDITYSRAGTGWYGNQLLYNTGFLSNDIFGLPLDLGFDYRRTEPYTFTHRISHNNFTNLGYNISTFAIPNSEIFSGTFNYRLNYRLEMLSGITYIIHGANPVTDQGIINVGGDINLGHRDRDPDTAKFLAGIREYYRTFMISLIYEPVNQVFIKVNLRYLNNSTQTELSQKEIQSFFTLTSIF